MSVADVMLAAMYDSARRLEARAIVDAGESLSVASRTTGIARSTIRAWLTQPEPMQPCPPCAGAWPARGADYSALLGYYLGDGCISSYRRRTTLRISCDAAWPGIVKDVCQLVRAVHPACGVFNVRAPGAVVIQGNWKHWPCLFPSTAPAASTSARSRSRTGRPTS